MSDLYDRLQASRPARIALPIAIAVLLIVGLAGPVWMGVPALLVIVAFVVWMGASSPDPTSGLARLRVLVAGILVALIAGRILTAFLD